MRRQILPSKLLVKASRTKHNIVQLWVLTKQRLSGASTSRSNLALDIDIFAGNLHSVEGLREVTPKKSVPARSFQSFGEKAITPALSKTHAEKGLCNILEDLRKIYLLY